MFTMRTLSFGSVATQVLIDNTPRTATIVNDGLCPVWLGDAGVGVSKGRILWPGDTYDYDQPEALYVIARGNPPGSITVDERRAQ